MRGAQARLVAADQLLQLGEVARGEQRKVLAHDPERELAPGGGLGKRAQLQLQALGRRARADAGRIQVLQVLERDREIVGLDPELRRQHLRDLLERLRQVAVLVERVDEHRDQPAVALGQRRQRELLEQMVAQRRRLGGELRVIRLVAFLASCAGAAAFEVPVGVRRALVLGRCRTFGGRGALRRRFGGLLGAVDARRGVAVVIALLALEQRVVGEKPLQLLIELERGQLEETDGLLQLRRQREVLRQLELQGLLHAAGSRVAEGRGSRIRGPGVWASGR